MDLLPTIPAIGRSKGRELNAVETRVFGRPRSHLSRRRGTKSADGGGVVWIIVFVVAFWLASYYPHYPTIVSIVAVVLAVFVVLAILGKKQQKQKLEEQARQVKEELLRQKEERARRFQESMRKILEQQEERHRREEQERAEQIEALLERDTFRESVHYMSGVEFENFMANVFDKKGYQVQTTPHQDQGVDLLLTLDDRKVAVQLKRYTAPVGNKAVADVVAGMFHYKAKEAWVITTSSFTKNAVELAKSNRVRLIDGRELEDWLDDLRDEA